MKELVTTMLFLRRGDEVLLAMKKRGHGVGKWNGVGGKLGRGESIEAAAVRECKEEIGVTPLVFTKVAEHEFFEPLDGAPMHMIVHTFICTEWKGDPTETEEMAPRWFKLLEVPYKQMWADDIHWLPQVLAGRSIRTNFRYDNDNVLQSHVITEVASFL